MKYFFRLTFSAGYHSLLFPYLSLALVSEMIYLFCGLYVFLKEDKASFLNFASSSRKLSSKFLVLILPSGSVCWQLWHSKSMQYESSQRAICQEGMWNTVKWSIWSLPPSGEFGSIEKDVKIIREKLYSSTGITSSFLALCNNFDYQSKIECEENLTHTFSGSKTWMFNWACSEADLHLADLDHKSLRHQFTVLWCK